MSVAGSVTELVAAALAEDLGGGDLTTDATVAADARGRARIIQKQPGVVFGLDAAAEAFRLTRRRRPRQARRRGNVVATRCRARSRWWRPGPRPARRRARRPQPARPPVRDRDADRPLRRGLALGGRAGGRSSTPARRRRCLRALEKAAVRAGGGQNHRMGLYDAILIKENHVAIAGGLAGGGRPRPAPPTPTCPSRSSAAIRPRSRPRSPPAPTASCSTTWTSTGFAPPSPPATRPDVAGDPRGLGRRRSRYRRRDLGDRRRLHLGRRAHALGPSPRPLDAPRGLSRSPTSAAATTAGRRRACRRSAPSGSSR